MRRRLTLLAGGVAMAMHDTTPPTEYRSGARLGLGEERDLSDGSRYEIYRRYFTVDTFTEELDGRSLFAGRWTVMATVGG